MQNKYECSGLEKKITIYDDKLLDNQFVNDARYKYLYNIKIIILQ